ncbi:hypothetical protein GCM10010279_29360 [Streptomyces mutabilis]|nr:hypothetical protein GCM10010279_29360 [Streptomyces mutabilis]
MFRPRAHIAMVGVPIVSHVLPSLALIRELVDRGHRVTYANAPFVADRIESAGAELVPCTSTLPVEDSGWPADQLEPAVRVHLRPEQRRQRPPVRIGERVDPLRSARTRCVSGVLTWTRADWSRRRASMGTSRNSVSRPARSPSLP